MTASQAVVIVIQRDGAVLGVARKDNPASFGLPGGKVEPGETLADAAARELREETGLVVAPASMAEVYRRPFEGREVVAFTAPDPGGVLAPCPGEAVAAWVGWPALTFGAFGAYNGELRDAIVLASPEGWIMRYGSGSLRRAREEQMKWREMYLAERVALEYGYGFAAVPGSRVTVGDALAGGDDPGTTETCWWARRLRWIARLDPARSGDVVRVVHARISDGDGAAEEGVGLEIVPAAWPSWLPRDRRIIALTVGADGRTENPC